MAWTISGHRIYTQKSLEDTGQIIPRLSPLSGGTILQVFGYDSLIRKMNALVVGDTIKNAIKAFSQDGGTSHALVSPEGSLGSFIVKSCAVNRLPIVCQLIDLTQPTTTPVYEVDLELYLDS